MVLQPHCDLHMLVNETLRLRPFERSRMPSGNYQLTPITGFQVLFFAPYRKVGERLGPDLPFMDGDLIRAARPGVYLFHVWWENEYQVGRLQVHSELVDWWFGQDSVTTTQELAFGITQPSVYARFSDSDPEVDLVGDITDCGLVELTSADTSKLRIDPGDRLAGLVETTGNETVLLRGRFRGGPVKEVPVRIVDTFRDRPILEPLRIERLSEASTVPNIVFLSEGFLAEDRDRFDAMVAEMVEDIFEKPRNEPFGMLHGSMNVFKAFAPSQQRGLTMANRIRDTGGDDDGRPIPAAVRYGGRDTYPLNVLIERVGLPLRGDNRSVATIIADWKLRRYDIDTTKITTDLVEAWRTERSDSILDARDTYFGLMLGKRPADRVSQVGGRIDRLTDDDPDLKDVREFQRRLYEFFDSTLIRSISSDPRRHPPQGQPGSTSDTPMYTPIVQYLGSLGYSQPPFQRIGGVWQPDDVHFKPSRGLVGFVVQDGLQGGTNFNDGTMCAVTLQPAGRLSYERDGYRLRRRINGYLPPDDVADLSNTFVHEFGHSLNLGDEYEEFDGESGQSGDLPKFDNLATRYEIRLGESETQIDGRKVKWLGLPRVAESARVIADATSTAGAITVRIHRRDVAHWYELWGRPRIKFGLRNQAVGSAGQQLPQIPDPTPLLADLKIVRVDRVTGDVALTGSIDAGLVYKAGSLLYSPRLTENGLPRKVGEDKVLARLLATRSPMNSDTDSKYVNHDPDYPQGISGFKGPCSSSRLIGVYEGGWLASAGIFRPAGTCRMRTSHTNGEDGEFCFVCRWLIVNRLDPSFHALLDARFYPEPKER